MTYFFLAAHGLFALVGSFRRGFARLQRGSCWSPFAAGFTQRLNIAKLPLLSLAGGSSSFKVL